MRQLLLSIILLLTPIAAGAQNGKTMRKNIGVYNALAPTPVGVVGAMVDGKPNWFEVAWTGIAESDKITISVEDDHFTTPGINANRCVSVNLIDETILNRADYSGIVSGKKADKSQLFEWTKGETGAPLLEEAPVTMECELLDSYPYGGSHLMVLQIKNTFVKEEYVDDKGKHVDFDKLKTLLFEPRFHYYEVGAFKGKCCQPGKEYKESLKETE